MSRPEVCIWRQGALIWDDFFFFFFLALPLPYSSKSVPGLTQVRQGNSDVHSAALKGVLF